MTDFYGNLNNGFRDESGENPAQKLTVWKSSCLFPFCGLWECQQPLVTAQSYFEHPPIFLDFGTSAVSRDPAPYQPEAYGARGFSRSDWSKWTHLLICISV